MADNLEVTEGTGTKVAADERSIGGETVEIQRVVKIGGSGFAADDVSVTTTSGEVVAARETRETLTILASPDNSQDVWVGPSGVNAATPSGGFRLIPGAAIDIPTTAAVHADTASGTQTIYYVETFS